MLTVSRTNFPMFLTLVPDFEARIKAIADRRREFSERMQARIQRLSLSVEDLEKAKKKGIEHNHTDESIRQRYSLMSDPKVREALDQLWSAANFDDSDNVIDKDEYFVMHRKLALALDATVTPKEWEQTVEQDWRQDASSTEMDREQFDW